MIFGVFPRGALVNGKPAQFVLAIKLDNPATDVKDAKVTMVRLNTARGVQSQIDIILSPDERDALAGVLEDSRKIGQKVEGGGNGR